MRFIAGDRGSGRTTALIEWARAERPGEPRWIVCHSRDAAAALHREDVARFESEGEDSPPPIRYPLTVEELQRYHGYRGLFAIDNLDLVLHQLVSPATPIEVVTIPTPEITKIVWAENAEDSLHLRTVTPRGERMQAAQIDTRDHDGMCAILRWCGGRAVDPETNGTPEDVIGVLRDAIHLRHGDWIIKRNGVFLRRSHHEFSDAYLLIDE